MSTVLFGWELGGGLGHVAPLVRLARELASDGHRPVFAVKDVVSTKNQIGRDLAWTVLQAPQWPTVPAVDSFQASSFADILLRKGYGDEAMLAPMLASWCDLLRMIDPKLVVTNYAPTLNLAAFKSVAQVIMGTGFTVPPTCEGVFPVIDGLEGKPANQPALLETIIDVQRELGVPALMELTDFIADAERFVCTLPELDPYQSIRKSPAVGPFDRLAAPTPMPGEAKFFAYVDGTCPNIADVLAALADAGLRGSVYLKKASSEMRRGLAEKGLVIEPAPIDWDQRLREFSIVVHHGGNATAMSALAAGRPQLVLPRFLEQDLTARSLERLDLAEVLRGSFSIERLVSSARRLMEDGSVIEAATTVANMIHERDKFDALDRMVDHCRDVLASSE